MTASSSLPYAVLGVSGRTGAAAADALLRSGHQVRVVVRDRAHGRHWVERGAELAVAELTDLAAMTAALSRVQGAYVLSPQDYGRDDLFEHAERIAATVARAAQAAGVPRLVALSSVGADRESGAGWIGMNRMLEQRLGDAGIPTAFLRAAYFMENWSSLVELALRTGTLPTFLAPPERRLPMVATADVGHAAAALLHMDWAQSRVVTLAGPADYAPYDVAAVLSSILGKPVEVAVVPQEQWAMALAAAPFSAAAVSGFIEMTRALNDAHVDIQSDARALAWTGGTVLARVIGELALRLR